MGLDLKMLPFDTNVSHPEQYSHTVLTCARDNEMFERVMAQEKDFGLLVPHGFSSYVSRDDKYEESHYGLTVITPYGESLKCLFVLDLLYSLRDYQPDLERNRAVMAYLRELSPQVKVALFWS